METKVKPARATSKSQGVGKPKAKPANAAGSSKAIPQAAFVLVPDAKRPFTQIPNFLVLRK